MTIEYDDDPNDIRYFDLIIGSNVFINKSTETYKDNTDLIYSDLAISRL